MSHLENQSSKIHDQRFKTIMNKLKKVGSTSSLNKVKIDLPTYNPDPYVSDPNINF